MKKYEFIDHTADLGILVKGKTLPELFSNAAYAMFDILVENIKKVEPKKSVNIKIIGRDEEDIFFDWLRELLSKFNLEKMVFKDFNIQKIDSTGLEAIVRGEEVDISRHKLKTELKAVTYHGLELKKRGDIWEAQVIFDI